jgi:hypothetical protein
LEQQHNVVQRDTQRRHSVPNGFSCTVPGPVNGADGIADDVSRAVFGSGI